MLLTCWRIYLFVRVELCFCVSLCDARSTYSRIGSRVMMALTTSVMDLMVPPKTACRYSNQVLAAAYICKSRAKGLPTTQYHAASLQPPIYSTVPGVYDITSDTTPPCCRPLLRLSFYCNDTTKYLWSDVYMNYCSKRRSRVSSPFRACVRASCFSKPEKLFELALVSLEVIDQRKSPERGNVFPKRRRRTASTTSASNRAE